MVKGDSFTLEHALTICYNILCAVNFIHSANIWHRDLHPENLLITQNCNVLIGDFGNARSKPVPREQQKDGLNSSIQTNAARRHTYNFTELPESHQKQIKMMQFEKLVKLDLGLDIEKQLSNQLTKDCSSSSEEGLDAEASDDSVQLTSRPGPNSLSLKNMQYSAPEIIVGNQSYNQKMDVWSIGCIFAKLLMNTCEFKKSLQDDHEFGTSKVGSKVPQTDFFDFKNAFQTKN